MYELKLTRLIAAPDAIRAKSAAAARALTPLDPAEVN